MLDFLTFFSLKCVPANEEADFTDFGYQKSLPLHARATASQVLQQDDNCFFLMLIFFFT